MTKQEFMAMSLPYELKVFETEYEVENGIIEYDSDHYGLEFVYANNNSYKPILRPLSDLTKEIEHNGEKFVPIVALAKMIKSKLTIAGSYIVDESLAPNCARCQDHYFWFNGDSFLYSILTDKKEHKLIVLNQRQLLSKLVEWHFDIAGLIEKQEAIDYHTLPDFVF